MENAGENMDEIGLEPAVAAAVGVEVEPETVAAPVVPKRDKRRSLAELDEERQQALHASFNRRISYLCKLAALVIAVVAFATIALGQEVPKFVLMGLCLSVALLAIAMLQDHYQHKQ